jgi:cytoskeletal protein CcmA (bactofilin family)
MIMSSLPRRRITDRFSASPTFIGAGTSITGDITCDADLAVAGEVIGDGDVRGSLTLSESGRWEGTVAAANAVIAGEVMGNVMCSGKLEIRKLARIHGSVRAGSIAIAQGAVVDGDMAVAGGAPVIRFEEKRREPR